MSINRLKLLLLGLVVVASLSVAGAASAATFEQKQAVRSAKQYLTVSAFSFKGLIGQLEYSGFSASNATYGAAHCGANWYAQAKREAKQYLKVSAFSYTGMVGQLKYSGFTTAQARYGAKAVGL